MPAAGVGRPLPVEVLEALLIVRCSAHLAGVSVLKLDPVEAQHKLVGLNKPLPDLLAAFKCLGSTRRRAGSSGDIAGTDVGLLGAPLSPIHLEAWTQTQGEVTGEGAGHTPGCCVCFSPEGNPLSRWEEPRFPELGVWQERPTISSEHLFLQLQPQPGGAKASPALHTLLQSDFSRGP